MKIKAGENSENILFIVSDGIETCEGNPVEEAKKLANSDLNVKVNIIGFNVDHAGQKQLKETAEAGNGTYYTVNSDIELSNTVMELLAEASATIYENLNKAQVSTKVNFYSVEVGKEIDEVSGLFVEAMKNEQKVLLEAIFQLQNRKQITETDSEELRLLVDERYEALLQYKDTLRTAAYDKSNAKRQEIIENIYAQ